MDVLCITSDRPGMGKTALASALVTALLRAGEKVAYFRPRCGDADGSVEQDTAFIYGTIMGDPSEGEQAAKLAMEPGPSDTEASPDRIVRQAVSFAEGGRANGRKLIVEAPSLLTPDGEAQDLCPRMAEKLDAGVVAVMGYYPDMDRSRMRATLKPLGGRLRGFLVNSVPIYRLHELRHHLAGWTSLLGVVPEDRTMLAVTVGQLAQHLDAQWVLGEQKADALIGHVLIGGNLMDRSDIYFGRYEDTAVVVRGDRPDIQLASLSSSTACLVLTGGHQPIPYVYNEAQQQEVPLLVVQGDTLVAAEATGTVQQQATAYHAQKANRFRHLMEEHAKLESVTSLLQ